MVKAPAPPYVGPPNHHGGSNNKPIKRIVIHSLVSGSGPGTAKQFASYFRGTSRMASCHYIVDPTTTLQLTYDSWVCFHAPPNQHSIGIELADNPGKSESQPGSVNRWNDADHSRTLDRAARLTAGLCLAYNIPIKKLSSGQLKAGQHGICGHVDVSYAWHQTSHWDPGNFPWSKFIDLVKKYANDPTATAAAGGQTIELKEKDVKQAISTSRSKNIPLRKSYRTLQVDDKNGWSILSCDGNVIESEADFIISNLPAGATVKVRWFVTEWNPDGPNKRVHTYGRQEIHGSGGLAYGHASRICWPGNGKNYRLRVEMKTDHPGAVLEAWGSRTIVLEK